MGILEACGLVLAYSSFDSLLTTPHVEQVLLLVFNDVAVGQTLFE